jgi:MFS family permease
MNSTQLTKDQRALRAVAMQFFINGAVTASYIPRLPEIRDHLGVDLTTIGQLLTAASVTGLLGSWLSSHVIRQFGTRTTMIYGTIMLIMLLPLIAAAPSVWALLIVLSAIMLVDVLVDVAMNIQGSNLSNRRAMPVMNRLHGLWSVGSVVGGIIAATMASFLIPLQWHLLGAAGLMGVGLIYIGRGLLTSDKAVPVEDGAERASPAPCRAPVSLWVFAILGGTAFVPEMVGSDWSPFRLKDDLETTAGMAGVGYVAFTVGMVIGRLSGDWVASKMSKVQLLNYAVLIAFCGLSIACVVDLVPLVYAALTMAGIGISVLFPSLYDAAAQDPRSGAALGAMTAGSRSIVLVAPLTIGLLADLPALSVGSAMAIMALPCLVVIGYLYRRIH